MRGRDTRGAGLPFKWLLLALVVVHAVHGQDPGQGQDAPPAPPPDPSPSPPPSPAPAPTYSCDRMDRVPRAERCTFVREQCESDSRLPYSEWYYCSVAPHGAFASFLFTLFLVALLPLLFTLLGDTAEIYFSPIMTHVAQCIPKMRPRFAGVTFVAIGNGAPDLSSNISAIRNGDWLLSTGALTGAAMFVQCVVAGEVMRVSGGPVKCRGATLRDVAIYSASVLLVLASFAAGRITHWFIAGACVLYLTYALWVFAGDEWHERGRPHARTLWRSLRDTWDVWFGACQEPQGLPWAAVDVGGPLSPRVSGTELLLPLVAAGRSDSLGWAAAPGAATGAGAGPRTTLPEPRVRSPGARPHQTHHHHHLMSAKAYQTMVWADLSPENPSGSSSSRSLAAAGGAGGGEDEEQGLLSRRRGGRKGRRQGGGGGGGGAASRGPGARGPAGSTLELGPAAGYAPPALSPSPPPMSSATAAPPSATAAAAARLGSSGGGSGLLTLSSLDGSALAAPAPVDAAPHWGSAAGLAAAGSITHNTRSNSAGGGAGPGSAAGADGGVARKASLAPSGGSGRLAGSGSGFAADPWSSGLTPAGSGLGPGAGRGGAGSEEGSYVGSEVEEDDEEGADAYDREAATVAAREARRRRSRQGDEEDEEGDGASSSEAGGDSGVSSREAGPPRELWARVQYELTVGNSIEWSDLPPESLQRRWRELTFPLLLPVYLALRLTIPFADPASYSRRWLLATCAAAPLLAAVYLAPSAAAALPMMIAAAVAGGALAAAVGYFTAGEEDALPDWDVLGTGFAFGPAAFAVFGFFMGVIWIDTLASEAVGVVGLLAGLLRVPASVMGLTLMAWGNSLGDFFGNPAMARRGQPTMALTACFAGPLFNMLASLALGFGSYFARKHVSSAEVMLRPEVALGCGFLLLYNAAVAAAGLLNGGKLPERFYVFARGWYGLYFVAACVLGLAAGQGDA
ncbi:hypothetical protein CHLRE_16g683595v5 [Chlamydomonas reinhardtii]|uniref:Sodium/calcium exchanger membrane region domain-containing protein n=1 Tax=Chlamydomonas reinhardtii TaxID=3055 RepID=A0A2K3CW13_CHLRE|nr:uncharacterized protein CHLRE_16g683595v5 [Chlamydomonas reinhardtii]PNW72472.1 hypothetical protein CHLRE_16g683595v5 [Chlamydomonas reinhardtii]